MPTKKRKRVATVEAERQQYFFLIYEQMGNTRSLNRLCELVHSVGSQISFKTLARYSAKYGWQVKILERIARQESAGFPDVKAQVEEMTRRHVETFQDIGALVTAGIKHYRKKIEGSLAAGWGGTLAIPLPEIARLAETYQRGERLARGEATSKSEVIVEVVAPLVKDFYTIFLAVNVITNDPPELVKRRQAEFINRGDSMLLNYYGQKKEIEGPKGD